MIDPSKRTDTGHQALPSARRLVEPSVVIWLSDDMSFREVALVQISIFSIAGLDVFAYHAQDQSRVRFLSNAAASNDYID